MKIKNFFYEKNNYDILNKSTLIKGIKKKHEIFIAYYFCKRLFWYYIFIVNKSIFQ